MHCCNLSHYIKPLPWNQLNQIEWKLWSKWLRSTLSWNISSECFFVNCSQKIKWSFVAHFRQHIKEIYCLRHSGRILSHRVNTILSACRIFGKFRPKTSNFIWGNKSGSTDFRVMGGKCCTRIFLSQELVIAAYQSYIPGALQEKGGRWSPSSRPTLGPWPPNPVR